MHYKRIKVSVITLYWCLEYLLFYFWDSIFETDGRQLFIPTDISTDVMPVQETVNADGGEIQMKSFGNDVLANGDPVIAVRVEEDNEHSLHTLGTGFEGVEDLLGQVAYVVETGNSTMDIGPKRGEELSGAYRVELFVMGVVVDFDKDT